MEEHEIIDVLDEQEKEELEPFLQKQEIAESRSGNLVTVKEEISPTIKTEPVDDGYRPWFENYRTFVRDTVEETLLEVRNGTVDPDTHEPLATTSASAEFDFEILHPELLQIYSRAEDEFMHSLEAFALQYFVDFTDVKPNTKQVRLVLPAKAPVAAVLKVCVTRIPPAFEALAPTFTSWHAFRCRVGTALWTKAQSDLSRRLKKSLFKRDDLDVSIVFNMKPCTRGDIDIGDPLHLSSAILHEILWTLMQPSCVAMADFSSANDVAFSQHGSAMLNDYFLKFLCHRIIFLVDKICRETVVQFQKRSREERDQMMMEPKRTKLNDGTMSSPRMGGLSASEDTNIIKDMYGLRGQSQTSKGVGALVEAPTGLVRNPDSWPQNKNGLLEILATLDAPDIIRLRRTPVIYWGTPHYADLDRVSQVLERAVREKNNGNPFKIRRLLPSDGVGVIPNQCRIYSTRTVTLPGGHTQKVDVEINKNQFRVNEGAVVNPLLPSVMRWSTPQVCPNTGNGFMIPEDFGNYLMDDAMLGYKSGKTNRLLSPEDVEMIANQVVERGKDGWEEKDDEKRDQEARTVPQMSMMQTETSQNLLGDQDWFVIKKTLNHLRAGGLNGLRDIATGVHLQIGPLREHSVDLGDPPFVIAEAEKKRGRRKPRDGIERNHAANMSIGELDISRRIWCMDEVKKYVTNPYKAARDSELTQLMERRNAELSQIPTLPQSHVACDLSRELSPPEFRKKANVPR